LLLITVLAKREVGKWHSEIDPVYLINKYNRPSSPPLSVFKNKTKKPKKTKGNSS
jgi:hypothetical protein